jgi:hypothetical protein
MPGTDSTKPTIEELIDAFAKDWKNKKYSIKSFNQIKMMVQDIIKIVETVDPGDGPVKKSYVTEIAFALITIIPINIKFLGVKIPSIFIKMALKSIISKLIDEIVEHYNVTGIFK